MRNLSSAIKLVPKVLGVAAVLAASHVMAQVPGQPGAQIFLQRPPLGVGRTGCPVAMSASQRSIPQQIETGSTAPRRPMQRLTITMFGWATSADLPRSITSAEVVAHALSPRSRVLLSSNSDDADITRTFHLEEKAGGGFNDLWMDGVTSIRWIEVKSITYSNGTVWHESETQKCSVRPNPFTLVSSAR